MGGEPGGGHRMNCVSGEQWRRRRRWGGKGGACAIARLRDGPFADVMLTCVVVTGGGAHARACVSWLVTLYCTPKLATQPATSESRAFFFAANGSSSSLPPSPLGGGGLTSRSPPSTSAACMVRFRSEEFRRQSEVGVSSAPHRVIVRPPYQPLQPTAALGARSELSQPTTTADVEAKASG